MRSEWSQELAGLEEEIDTLRTVRNSKEHRASELRANYMHMLRHYHQLAREKRERLKSEWSQEIARIWDEIATLNDVLRSKLRHTSELSQKMGMSPFQDLEDRVKKF